MNPLHFLSIIFLIIFWGCGAVPTNSRYEQSSDDSLNISNEQTSIALPPPFTEIDISHLRDSVIQTDPLKTLSNSKLIFWKQFSTTNETGTDMNKIAGFRVQLYKTDNIQDADSVLAAYRQFRPFPDIYLDFQSPFYIVKFGNFPSWSVANDASLKAGLLGFKNTLVIPDSILVSKSLYLP